MGMAGGGTGALIGAVHRIAAAIDGQIELVCGAFSSDAQRSICSGRELFLAEQRCYGDYVEMIRTESALPPQERMQFVAIVTPNHRHFPIARLALEHGFHVMSDKPATFSLGECLELRDVVRTTGLLDGLTPTYTGYPMVKEARELVASGRLGTVRKIVVEYPQGWLADRIEDTGQKQASWRLDPARAGLSSCMGDIGVHAANLAEYVSGLLITHMCADLHSFVAGRTLDDDGSILLRFEKGARGVLMASQISVGEENSLRIRLYGEKGGLEWAQQEPNTLWLKWNDQPTQVLRTAGGYLGAAAKANTRTPGGHPEGYLEAFANLYRTFASQIRIRHSGGETDTLTADLPGIEEAVRGMAFIEHAVAASAGDTKWHELPRY
jgi:predicted dehydrogenase